MTRRKLMEFIFEILPAVFLAFCVASLFATPIILAKFITSWIFP